MEWLLWPLASSRWPGTTTTTGINCVTVYAAAPAQIFGGAAIQFRRLAKTGAAVLGVIYLFLALLCVPQIIVSPQIYDSWGNFFEQFSLLTGAAIVCARSSSPWAPKALPRIGRILFGICAASFALEQAIYLDATAKLVPKWFLPSQVFWAVATTVFFALAVVTLLTNRMALLATRLLTMMLIIFGLLVEYRCFFQVPTIRRIGAKPPRPSRLPEQHGFSLVSSASISLMTRLCYGQIA